MYSKSHYKIGIIIYHAAENIFPCSLKMCFHFQTIFSLLFSIAKAIEPREKAHLTVVEREKPVQLTKLHTPSYIIAYKAMISPIATIILDTYEIKLFRV